MLIGISVALIIAATMAVAVNKLARRNFTFTSQDQQGLSTLEWILLVAAVGGLATAGVIIVRNAVSGAGEQVDDTARLERIAQTEVNEVMLQGKGSETAAGTVETLNATTTPTDGNVALRCKVDYFYYHNTSGGRTYPLRKWRGQFTFKVVTGTGSGTHTDWCDAVPTNNLQNNVLRNTSPRGTGVTFS